MADSLLLREALAILKELDAAEASQPFQPLIPDPRRTVRHACRLEIILNYWRDEALVRSWALTRDLSAGGLSCLHREALPIGSSFAIKLPLLAGGHHEVQAQVRHSKAVAGGWHLLGLMFLEMIDPRKFHKP